MEQPRPIKRSKELMPLSREHHDGLLLVWKIKTGLSKAIEAKRIAGYVVFFYVSTLEAHFNLEEEFVFSLLPEDNVLRVKAESQHNEIKEMVSTLKLAYNKENLLQFADLLERHIRFEERELFNFIEQNAIPELLLIAAAAMDSHASSNKQYWNDEFWAKK